MVPDWACSILFSRWAMSTHAVSNLSCTLLYGQDTEHQEELFVSCLETHKHTTRKMVASWALFRGVSVQAICSAASWCLLWLFLGSTCLTCQGYAWLVQSLSSWKTLGILPTGRYLFDKLFGNTRGTICHSKTLSVNIMKNIWLSHITAVLKIIWVSCLTVSGLLTEVRGCYLHALFTVDETAEWRLFTNQDWQIEISASLRARRLYCQ